MESSFFNPLPSTLQKAHPNEVALSKVKAKEAAMRKEQEIRFPVGDDNDDEYTRGPIRVVPAFDGVEYGCPALLLNTDFSEGIILAIKAQQELIEMVRTTRDQDAAADALRYQLEDCLDGICSRISRLAAQLSRVVREQDMDEGVNLQKAIQLSSETLDRIGITLRNESKERQDRHIALRMRFRDFAKRQDLVNDYLETAFIHAGLLPPEENPSSVKIPCTSKSKVTTGLQRLDGQLADTTIVAGTVEPAPAQIPGVTQDITKSHSGRPTPGASLLTDGNTSAYQRIPDI